MGYRIAQNVGGGKHWRIGVRFAKIFPVNVFMSVNLISHDPVDWKTCGSNMATGILKYLKPVTLLSSSNSLTLPDLNGPSSEKVPAKAIELANAEVEQQLKVCCGDSQIAPPVGSLVTNEREGLLCAADVLDTYFYRFAKFYAPNVFRPATDTHLDRSRIDRVRSFLCQCYILLIRQSFTLPTFCAIRYLTFILSIYKILK